MLDRDAVVAEAVAVGEVLEAGRERGFRLGAEGVDGLALGEGGVAGARPLQRRPDPFAA